MRAIFLLYLHNSKIYRQFRRFLEPACKNNTSVAKGLSSNCVLPIHALLCAPQNPAPCLTSMPKPEGSERGHQIGTNCFSTMPKQSPVQGLQTSSLPVGSSLECLWSDLEKRQGTPAVEVNRERMVSGGECKERRAVQRDESI